MDILQVLWDATDDEDALAVTQILAQHPDAALMRKPNGCTALHFAAFSGRSEVAEILATAAPAAALIPDFVDGNLPLHEAASDNSGGYGVVDMLLAVEPAAALVANHRGSLPLHVAAERRNFDEMCLLAEAAPEAALQRDNQGRTPLDIVLTQFTGRHTEEAICALLMLGTTTDEQLEALQHVQSADLALPGYAEVVAAAPLTVDQWALVPTPCPALAPLLPAVLARSHVEAGLLVQRLPKEQRERLRCAVLSLARVQRTQRSHLPQELTTRILDLAFS